MKIDLSKALNMAFDNLLCFFGLSEVLYHITSGWFIITAINTT